MADRQANTFQSVIANAIRLVKVIQESSGTPGSFPNTTLPVYYKCMPATIVQPDVAQSGGTLEGIPVSITDTTDPDKAIFVANFRRNSPVLGNYYVVFRLSNGTYVFDNQMAFLENQ